MGVLCFCSTPKIPIYLVWILKFPQDKVGFAGVQPKLYPEHLRVLRILLAYPIPKGGAAVIAVDDADTVRTDAAAKLCIDHDLCLIKRHAVYIKFNYAFGHTRAPYLLCAAPTQGSQHIYYI